ncbi:CubicO group peptidase, beta-lactamase class C family [Saccharopolyspora shandongensis]|uniref:CubicO group peptidase, beta-lactamase class C family n=1 Tax=Saccharopolyspora shandongensis TaxID=418495 RepID=A0A1H3MP97_9PSEU|nr:serine hydrolase domain-containing protein [Saccharopolyspora shandongensis]SDY78481.1 CubicO group peptidase, beta-lactamase class C family [Saccharopolyspora shandongensis]
MRGKLRHGNVPLRGIAIVAILLVIAGAATASATLLFLGEQPSPPQLAAPPPIPAPGPEPDHALRDGQPGEVGLNPAPIAAAQGQLAAGTQPSPGHPHPSYAGEVSLLARDGVVVSRQATGFALRYADAQGPELPAEQQEKTQNDTIFDLASLTKLFTSIAVLQLADDGRVNLNAPVADYVPEFAASGKQKITVQELLTHTSGLQAKIELWRLPPPARLPAVLSATPQNPPGAVYRYSDLNMITLGVLVERMSGRPLDAVVHDRITAPLGMTDTGYRPPRDKLHRIAATEFETDPPRGLVRGEVQDENAWSLGGVAGHAGIFSTADDLAVLGQALLDGGTYRNQRILRPETVRAMLTNYNTAFPRNAHGLGFELDQPWYMAGLSGPHTAGHTGFTGTSLVIDPGSRSIVVLLTNAVHPSRTWGSIGPARLEIAQGMALALGPPGHDG